MRKLTILFAMLLYIPLASFTQEANASSLSEKISASGIAKKVIESVVADVDAPELVKQVAVSEISKELSGSQEEVSIMDFAKDATEVFKLVKGGTAGALAIASAVLALLLQLLKLKIIQPLVAKNRVLTFAITTSISGIMSVTGAMLSGMKWQEAIIAGLLTSGGAMAMYSSWRAV
ncbi:hypothetical protein KAU11_11640, partial [Candidatus Babeliales bacterium]|nr:hypothetical protein [Candidatus Babeliales bacterium]